MKSLVLFFICFFAGFSAPAQTWCPPGATWHYAVSGMDIDGVIEYTYSGDTLINSLNCKKITGTFTGIKPLYLNTFTVIPNYKNYFTYENNHVLFLHNGSTFDTVVNYNAAIGDKWLGTRDPVTDPNFPCNVRTAMTVTDTGHIAINGFSLKKVVISCTSSVTTLSQMSTLVRTNTFVTRVYSCQGDINSRSDMFPLFCGNMNAASEHPIASLRCYTDNTFPLYSQGQYGCTSLTGMSKNSITDQIVTIFPNPISDELHIKFSNAQSSHTYRVCLINAMGQIVFIDDKKEQLGQNEILKCKTEGLKSGIYFLQIYEKENLVNTQKVIKN